MMEFFYFLIRTKYQQTSLKCSENFTCNYSTITSPVENSQPSNLHFRVEEIFTLKSITLYVWHILEHRKSIYLREMRNSGMILAKKLLKSPHFIPFYLPVLHLPILNPSGGKISITCNGMTYSIAYSVILVHNKWFLMWKRKHINFFFNFYGHIDTYWS